MPLPVDADLHVHITELELDGVRDASSGLFLFHALNPGAWTLVADGPGYISESQSITLESTELQGVTVGLRREDSGEGEVETPTRRRLSCNGALSAGPLSGGGSNGFSGDTLVLGFALAALLLRRQSRHEPLKG